MSGSTGVSELEFELDRSCPLCKASVKTTGVVALEYIVPRSDGETLAYGTARDATPDNVTNAFHRVDSVSDIIILDTIGDRVHFEIVTTGSLEKSLADHWVLIRGLTARDGQGRLVVDVPAHVKPRSVVDEFLAEFPDANLTAIRNTDRRISKVADKKFRDDFLAGLTDRQQEVLQTAHREGYFELPRRVPGVEIARDIGISSATFSQHLRRAQQKVFDRLFPDR